MLTGDAGLALLNRAGRWHEWNPRWLPTRATRAIKQWKLRRYARPVECRLQTGQRLMISPDDVMQWTVATTGGWEELIYESIRPLVSEGSTVLDIGAHIGTSAVVFADWVGPSGRVVCFEPAPWHTAYLGRNIALNGLEGRVTIVPAAASDREGVASLSPRDVLNGGMSAIVPDDNSGVTVRTTSIDQWVESQSIRDVALIKIDIEGAEALALNGMRAGLARQWYRAILLEIHAAELPRFGESVESVLSILDRSAYRVLFWRDDAFSENAGTDAVYVLGMAPTLAANTATVDLVQRQRT